MFSICLRVPQPDPQSVSLIVILDLGESLLNVLYHVFLGSPASACDRFLDRHGGDRVDDPALLVAHLLDDTRHSVERQGGLTGDVKGLLVVHEVRGLIGKPVVKLTQPFAQIFRKLVNAVVKMPVFVKGVPCDRAQI